VDRRPLFLGHVGELRVFTDELHFREEFAVFERVARNLVLYEIPAFRLRCLRRGGFRKRRRGLRLLAGPGCVVAVIVLWRDSASRHERITAGVCHCATVALRVVLLRGSVEDAAAELFAGFVDEYRLHGNAGFAKVRLLHQRDAVAVERVDYGFDARCQVCVAALEMRICGRLERGRELLLRCDKCLGDVRLFVHFRFALIVSATANAITA